MRPDVSITVRSEMMVNGGDPVPKYLELVLENAQRIADMCGFDDESKYKIDMSLREIYVNAVAHGNKGNKEKYVTVGFTLKPNELEISIYDQGDKFDPTKFFTPPDATTPEGLERALRDNGRGITISKALLDDLFYTYENGNVAHLIKRRSSEAKPVTEARAYLV